jgi:hypothetical protein
MLKILNKNSHLIIYLIIIGVINLILLKLPLTNVFGYEFSALNALLLSFLSGLFNISFLKSLVKENKKFNLENYLSTLRWMFFLPFAISVINSIIFGFCSFTDGLLFYFVITFPSVIIGSALSSAIFIFVKKLKVISFIFLYLLILFIPVLEIYFNPQVYLYNPLFAYFPGTIYDEGLSVDLKLTLYRIFNVIFFFSLLFCFLNWTIKGATLKKKLSFLVFAIIIAGLFYFIVSPLLGFTTTKSSLKEKLSHYVESKHFIIQADSRIEKDVIQRVVLNQEYYYLQHSIIFKEEPTTKIKSFIFFDSEQKKNLFGAGSADVAKPWLNSIYVSADTWESTINHEIAHCFTAGFGTGIFKLAAGFNPALIEGVAEAADGFYDENSIHYLASLAYKYDYRIDLNSMLSSFSFFGSVSSLSYIYSGSFIEYLINEYGVERVKQFYQNNDFEKSFATDLNSVVKNYEMFLQTLTIDATRDKANYYFGRKPLISKVCPRYVSSTLEKAWDYYSSKNYVKAKNIFEDILSKTDSYTATIGLSKIYEDIDSVSMAISILESKINTFEGTSSEYDLKFRLAELYIKNDESKKAKDFYYFLLNAKPNRRLELVSSTRISLLKNRSIKSYVTGSDYDRYEILKELNLKTYDYASIPLMIDLSNSLGEDYHAFLLNFENNLDVKDELSSYAVFKLSEYMLQNFDYIRARKMAGLALRFSGNFNLLKLTEENSKKSEWFIRNGDSILKEKNFELNY